MGPFENEGMHEFEKFDKIATICKEFEAKYKIGVSEHAQKLLKDIIDAIKLDPHPRWKVTEEQLTLAINTYMSDLPKNLYSVAKEESVKEIITFFDILHWFSGHINALCLFSK